MIQSRAASAITTRVNDLNAAVGKVNADTKLGSDSPALVSYLQKGIPGLQQLGQKIAGDATAPEAESDVATIFTNYRVLALVIPAARLAATSDQIGTNTIPKLTAASTKAAGYETSTNQAALAPLLVDLHTQIASATTSASGVAATVLGYTPAQFNANQNLLAASKASVSSAQTAVKKAVSDLQQIRAAVKAGK
ncbi:MAG TPA: hypothetical protein VHT49_05375 [Acidimicrobiales bacterium]|jgi:hypothetical protein|nr:hypothetical protein [Acidimicrobiales bacterium]